jgi:hypothetical protein
VRRDDGTWLLTGVPVGLPEPDLERVVPLRRRLLPPERAAGAPAPVISIATTPERPVEPVRVGAVEMRAVLERLRGECRDQVDEMRLRYAAMQQLASRTSALREECKATRERFPNAAG